MLAGWLSEQYGGRRAPIVVPMLALLAGLSAVFPLITVEATLLLVICLAAVGACTYAPDMLIVHTMAMDVATRKAAASACGFINFFGSVGGAISVGLTGHLAETAGWSSVVGLWAGGAALAAVMVSLLWNVRGGHGDWV